MRIQKLQKQLQIACLIENPIDLFYLTGIRVSKGRLLLSCKEAKLFVDGRYYEAVKKNAPCPVFHLEEMRIDEAQAGFDRTDICYGQWEALKREFPNVEWVPIDPPLKEMRSIKGTDEIASLKRAAQLTLQGIEKVANQLQEGVSEQELAWEFEKFCRENGASRLSFDPIIAFGPNSAFPHHRSGKTALQKGQIVLIDAGAVVDDYCGDLTRVFHYQGVDERIAQLEETVKRAKDAAISKVRPGIRAAFLDETVRSVFKDVKQLYTHSLGHGIGLETHEFPLIRFDGKDKDVVLKEGMVFTIEPGLYLPGVGGVRIEEMILVTRDGCLNLEKKSSQSNFF